MVNQAMQCKVETIALQAALQLSALHALILEGIVAQTDNRETQMAEWSHEYAALLQDFYAHSAAVELIQGEHFDGHLILYPEQETELTEAARTIESAVVTANDYLNRRATRADASTNGGAVENKLAIGLESVKAGANGQRATAIAQKWQHDASREAVETDEEQWERCRIEFGAT